MTDTRTSEARVAGPLEQRIQFSLDTPVELDVVFCDLVHAREPSHGGPFDLRFRGTRLSDHARVRAYVPLAQVEGALLDAGALAAAVRTDGLPAGGGGMAVPLEHYALTFTKERRGNGDMRFAVQVRDGAAGGDVALYRRGLEQAADEILPALAKRGLAAGAAEVVIIADALFAVRVNRRRRGAR